MYVCVYRESDREIYFLDIIGKSLEMAIKSVIENLV